VISKTVTSDRKSKLITDPTDHWSLGGSRISRQDAGKDDLLCRTV